MMGHLSLTLDSLQPTFMCAIRLPHANLLAFLIVLDICYHN